MLEITPPPQNPDAESAVLGSLLIDGKLINNIMELLKPDDFYKTANQEILSAMIKMHEKNIPIDLLTTFEYLNTENKIDTIGGSEYLTYLTEVVPSTSNIAYYAKLVKETSQKRKFTEFTEMINKDIKEQHIDCENAREKLKDFLSEMEIEYTDSEIIQLSQKTDIKPREYLLEDLIPLNYPTTLFAGGGVGKSYLAVYLAINACAGGKTFLKKKFHNEAKNTLYLDYELDEEEFTRRAREICNGLCISDIPDNFFYKSPELRISKLIHKLPGYIKANNIKFVIIDSMGASGLDSMDEKAVIYIYSKLRKLGVTTLLLDHQSKQQPQDYEKHKTPFGSAYKSFLSRSVIHLVQQAKKHNCVTLQLIHDKTNFGRKCDVEYIDFIFDTESCSVYIKESTYKFSRDSQIQTIQNHIQKAYDEDKELNQSDLIEGLRDYIKKDKLRVLLDEGKEIHWIVKKGLNNSNIYVPMDEVEDL